MPTFTRTVARRLRPGWALIILCVTVLSSCSRDPHTIVIGNEQKDDFSSLVRDSKQLTGEEMALLKAAESRLRRARASDQVVGETIEAVIADQRRWQTERQQLVNKLEPLYRAGKA